MQVVDQKSRWSGWLRAKKGEIPGLWRAVGRKRPWVSAAITPRQQERLQMAASTRLDLAKGGTASVVIGGLFLGISLAFPLVWEGERAVFAFQVILLKSFWFRSLLPLFYLVGLTSAAVKITSRWSSWGAPPTVWGTHLVTTSLLTLGSGIVLHWALIAPQDFNMTMIAFALLFWWPAFLMFLMTWITKKPLAWKVARLTWLSVSLSLMHFSIILFNVLYTKQFQTAWGLWFALLGSVILIAGALKMEQKTIEDEARWPLL